MHKASTHVKNAFVIHIQLFTSDKHVLDLRLTAAHTGKGHKHEGDDTNTEFHPIFVDSHIC